MVTLLSFWAVSTSGLGRYVDTSAVNHVQMHLLCFLDPHDLYLQSRYFERSGYCEHGAQATVGDSEDERLPSRVNPPTRMVNTTRRSYGQRLVHSRSQLLGFTRLYAIVMGMDFPLFKMHQT